jgi:hypothetical protein
VQQSPPAPVLRRAPLRLQRQQPARKQSSGGKKSSRAPAKRTLPRARAEIVADPSSSDRMLLIGGLALVVLIIGDTVFLSLSARFLRV